MLGRAPGCSAGGSYAEAILTAIENASCFVLVYSQNSNASRHVLREVERALSLGINIIPVRFDSSSVSKSLDYLLATVHWLSVIAEPREIGIGHAAERIASTFSESERQPSGERFAAAAPAVPVRRPATASFMPLLIWLTLGFLAVAGIAFAVVNLRHAAPNEPVADAPPAATAMVATETTAAPPPTVTSVQQTALSAAPPPPAAQPPATTPDATDDEGVQEIPQPTTSFPRTAISRESPSAVVRRYYGYLGDRNTIKAYELLSTDYRRRETFVNYTRSFASTTALRLLSAREKSIRGGIASVEVAFEKNNQKFGRIEWRGPIELVSEPGGWHINSVRGLRPSSTRH